MRAAVVTFPGSNCDRDLAVAFERAFESKVTRVWHGETSLPALDVIGIPGGFTYGDYLRVGAIAARSPVMREVARLAERGTLVLGVCNGFQTLCEAGMLPGALVRNAGLAFVCRFTPLEVATRDSPFTNAHDRGQRIHLPVAHHDGNYVIEDAQRRALEDADRIALRYLDNPNGSTGDIAGVLSERRNVLGMMPHPERAIHTTLGGTDGLGVLRSIVGALV